MGDRARPSLSLEGRSAARVSSGSRPSSPLAAGPITPHAHAARPSSPLAMWNSRPSTPLVPRPGTPLSRPPVTSSYDDEGSFATTRESDTLQFNESIVVREPVTPSRKRQLPSPDSAPIDQVVMEDGMELVVVAQSKPTERLFGLQRATTRPSLDSVPLRAVCLFRPQVEPPALLDLVRARSSIGSPPR